MKELYFTTFDGEKLFCHLWDEVENPKGVVVLSHGMSEHAASVGYTRLAEYLNKNGYIAFGDDHRAHGLTETDETRGYHKGDNFEDTVRDELFICDYLKKEYNLPVYYYGHSYGSFIGQAVLERGSGFSGFVLTGSSVMSPVSTTLGYIFSAPLQWIKKDMKMTILGTISDMSVKNKFKGEEGFGVWLTRDKNLRNLADTDKLVGAPVSISFCRSMLKGIKNAEKKQNFEKVNRDIPIAIFSGSMDMAGGFGKGIEKLYCIYKNLGVKNVKFKLYDGARHNLLNETNRDEVMKDIVRFIDACVEGDKNYAKHQA